MHEGKCRAQGRGRGGGRERLRHASGRGRGPRVLGPYSNKQYSLSLIALSQQVVRVMVRARRRAACRHASGHTSSIDSKTSRTSTVNRASRLLACFALEPSRRDHPLNPQLMVQGAFSPVSLPLLFRDAFLDLGHLRSGDDDKLRLRMGGGTFSSSSSRTPPKTPSLFRALDK